MNRVPEPALIRSALVAVTGIIALVVGHAIDVSWIESVVTVYAVLSPIVAGILIRPAVTPVGRQGAGGTGGADRPSVAGD